ncbi:MAG: hypothetical protein F4Z75_09860 [Synechococcus sp. SB0668_bin_15]|nr:hypothetical protein [Synechococcus sp. SB0668_bin_15]MXZ83823.1 hypothetical protein [Synechococcus sp. SB0666_bin_14]MYA91442.1 hypothetical protein [Synechococcus sp. SB0663_bin_10]MYC50271.1 hypothetical protein [Synechococcus sp. SB0662_bin_14]MYG46576.1 hypothetical protein [Synechococcus sp. SB0675_bin_6]MYJ59302.1 hypothetical protein [Synechococcus sp. SB0672_bin_6]MYK90577.1 hypothetical protein [Synechococcus sp. SB0669_bin_8]
MGQAEQRAIAHRVQQQLTAELEALYRGVFDRMSREQLGEGAMARLTQVILRSRDGALSPLQESMGPAPMAGPQEKPSLNS